MRRRHVFSVATLVGLMVAMTGVPRAQNQFPPPAGFPPLTLDLDAMFRERQILGQFDASKNGRLENAERKAAREWLAKQPPTGLAAVIGRIAGPGGAGGPRGAPPGLPPLGGRGLAPGSPGQRLSPDAVRTYRDEPFYDTNVLRTLYLQFENADWQKELSDFYNTDVDVPAVLTVDGRASRDVGVRFRGMSSYAFIPEGSKRSLNVTIDFADKDQRVQGYRTLNLLNANSDPTFVRAVLYSHIARQYVPAAKVNYARVVINGESWGVYLNAEQYNSDFVRDRFKDKGGARWKLDARWQLEPAASSRRASAAASRAAAFFLEPLVHVVRQDVYAALAVQIDVVIARARPIAVGVDERDFDGQELQRAIDVEERGERRFKTLRRGLIQHAEHFDQAPPRLLIVA